MTAKVRLVRFDFAAQRGVVLTVPRQPPANRLLDPFSTVTVDPDDASRLHGGDLQGEEIDELVQLSVR